MYFIPLYFRRYNSESLLLKDVFLLFVILPFVPYLYLMMKELFPSTKARTKKILLYFQTVTFLIKQWALNNKYASEVFLEKNPVYIFRNVIKFKLNCIYYSIPLNFFFHVVLLTFLKSEILPDISCKTAAVNNKYVCLRSNTA